MEEIYIASINKKISMHEFKKHVYKEGHAYMINNSLIHKCIGYNEHRPIVEELVILNKVNKGDIQVIFYPGSVDISIPSLDFVNGILSGKYKEIEISEYDNLKNKLNNLSESLSNQMKELYDNK